MPWNFCKINKNCPFLSPNSFFKRSPYPHQNIFPPLFQVQLSYAAGFFPGLFPLFFGRPWDNHTNTSSACESLPGIVVFIPHTRRLYLYWLDHSRMRPSSSNSCKERPRRVTRRGLSIIFGLSHQPDQQLEADEQDRLVQQIDEYGMPPTQVRARLRVG